jgi:hypothetical protein
MLTTKIITFLFFISIGIFIAIVGWKFSKFTIEKDSAIATRALAIGIAIVFFAIGILAMLGLLDGKKQRVTLHYIDTNTTVCYENARIVTRNNGIKILITEDGKSIQVVNAEIETEDM